MVGFGVHGVATATIRLACAVVAAELALAVLAAASAGEPAPRNTTADAPPPAWPTSPFHGVISGATGEPIPCRCRFKGGAYRLGDTVCMATHLGVQLARCDLILNNTSWVPTGVPCSMSLLSRRPAAG
jgi:hypothetical protein